MARYPYDESYEPPAAVLPLRASAPGRLDEGTLIPALVDTGADMTVLPEAMIRQLRLPPVGQVEAHGFRGALQSLIVYAAELQVEGTTVLCEVLAGNEALLGRDILGRCVLVLDGPRKKVELRSSRVR